MTPYYADDAVELYLGDALDVLRELGGASVDAVVTDPPYGLAFMGRKWDRFGGEPAGACEECGNDDPAEGYRLCLDCLEQADEADLRGAGMLGQRSPNWHDKATHSRGYADNNNAAYQRWCERWATECLRVLKSGGHLLAFGGTRTWHRLACAVEDAGFEVRDSIAWLYGSGFPKSLDVSKAIDKAAGAERDEGVPGRYATRRPRAEVQAVNAYQDGVGNASSALVTAPATDTARTWQGWGTALKPAFEPVVVARKPLAGTVAANVTMHGTGALNIDATRIGDGGQLKWAKPRDMGYHGGTDSGSTEATTNPAGRWPANVVLDEGQAAALDQQSGERPSGRINFDGRATQDPTRREFEMAAGRGYDDLGGASRFFYIAKADTTERVRVNGTAHPTVKPLALMRWLVRLVTPPGGTVLDPFAGSGTTAEACILEGFRCITVEREADYLPLIRQRLNRRRDPVAAIKATDDDPGLFALFPPEED